MNWKSFLDREKIKAWPLRLKVSLGTIGCGLTIILLSGLLGDSLSEQAGEVVRLRSDLNRMRAQTAELRKQVERYPELKKQYLQILAAGLTAAPDRVTFLKNAQSLASENRVQELTYKLDVEPLKAAPFGKFQVNSILVNFESSSALDVDSLNFWSDVLSSLPGHFQVAKAVLERKRVLDPPTLAALKGKQNVTLVHSVLTFRWITLVPPGSEGS